MAKRFTTGEQLLEQVMHAQTLKAETIKDGPRLDYNLEVKLDERRKQFKALTTRFRLVDSVDFSSNDILSLSSSGLLRRAWNAEMAKYPNAQIGSGGSRLLDGSHPYTEDLEARIAKFHGCEGAMILNSGCECNHAIFGTIPQKEDVILYDELVHASIHDGMAQSRCKNQLSFKHNDLDDFESKLRQLRESHGQLRGSSATLFISVEAIYSMDGDITPLAEMVALAKTIYPEGNASFIIDEAHATGVLGQHGQGLVGMLGLEKDVSIRVHTYSKAMASQGGVILSNNTIRDFLINFSRAFMYTAAPTFSNLAAIKCAYDIFETDEIVVRQFRIQWLVRLFCVKVRELKHYQRAKDTGYLAIPVAEGFQTRQFMSHIVPLWSPAADALSVGLVFSKITAYPVAYPTVPRGQKRVRLVFHAANTEQDVMRIIAVIDQWLEERFQGDEVAQGMAATWEDYGKLQKAEEPHLDGHANGHVNGNGAPKEASIEIDSPIEEVKKLAKLEVKPLMNGHLTNGNHMNGVNGANGVHAMNGVNGVNSMKLMTKIGA